jgi:hypothetical protein
MLGTKLNQPYEMDGVAGDYPIIIDIEHHKIHKGVHYACQDYDDDVDTATPKYWLVVTPNTSTRVHFNFNTIASKQGLIEFFENPTITDNGTAITPCNSDRNSSNTAELLCYKDPTISSDGTRLGVNVTGSDSASVVGGSGGSSKRDDEFILKQNTGYIVKFTTKVNDARVSNCFKWYEI